MKNLFLILVLLMAQIAHAQSPVFRKPKLSKELEEILQQQIAREARPAARGTAIKPRLKTYSYHEYGSVPKLDSIIYFYAPGHGGTDSLINKDYDDYPSLGGTLVAGRYNGLYPDSAQAWHLSSSGILEKNFSQRYAYNSSGLITQTYTIYPLTSTSACTRQIITYDNNGNRIKDERATSPVGSCGNYVLTYVTTQWFNGANQVVKDSIWSNVTNSTIYTTNLSYDNQGLGDEVIYGSWVNGQYQINAKYKYRYSPVFTEYHLNSIGDTGSYVERRMDNLNRAVSTISYGKDVSNGVFKVFESTYISYLGNSMKPILFLDSTLVNGQMQLTDKYGYHLNSNGMYDTAYYFTINNGVAVPSGIESATYRNDGLVDSVNGFAYNSAYNYTNTYYYEDYNTAAGISPINAAQQIITYPNPVQSVLHIQSPANKQVRIMNITGKMLYEGQGVNEVHVQEYPKGIYLLQTTDNNGYSTTGKFIKE